MSEMPEDVEVHVFNAERMVGFYGNAFMDGVVGLMHFMDIDLGSPEAQMAIDAMLERLNSEDGNDFMLDRVHILSTMLDMED